jgi:RNA polymerase sigma factor (sigma-70 family)
MNIYGPTLVIDEDISHTENRMSIDDLVARCQAGDTHAVAEMVSTYAAFVYRVCLMVLRQVEDAEDAMQESLVKAVRALGAYSHKDEASFRAWLHRIALNTAISRVRRQSLPQVAWEAAETAPAPEADPERLALDRLTQAEVMAALDQLSEGHRLVVVLRYYNGLSCEEIAEQLGVPAGTVGSRLFNARRQLKGLLTSIVDEGA